LDDVARAVIDDHVRSDLGGVRQHLLEVLDFGVVQPDRVVLRIEVGLECG